MEFLALVLLLLFSLFLFSVNGFQFWAFYFSCFNDIAIQGNSSLTIFKLRGPWQRSLPSTVTCPIIDNVKGGIFPAIWISKRIYLLLSQTPTNRRVDQLNGSITEVAKILQSA